MKHEDSKDISIGVPVHNTGRIRNKQRELEKKCH